MDATQRLAERWRKHAEAIKGKERIVKPIGWVACFTMCGSEETMRSDGRSTSRLMPTVFKTKEAAQRLANQSQSGYVREWMLETWK